MKKNDNNQSKNETFSKANLFFGILNTILLFVLLSNSGHVSNSNSGQDSGISGTAITSISEISTKINNLQQSIDLLSSKYNTPISSSTFTNCSGTLNQNLTGSSYTSGSFTDFNLSGTSPLNLSCSKL